MESIMSTYSRPLMRFLLGLGNSPEEPWRYTLGVFDHPLIAVTRAVYDLWEVGELHPTLWAACEELARAERDAGSTEPEATDPALALTAFLGTVHHLLATSAVYLEPVDA